MRSIDKLGNVRAIRATLPTRQDAQAKPGESNYNWTVWNPGLCSADYVCISRFALKFAVVEVFNLNRFRSIRKF